MGTATTQIYTLSLHDALPISAGGTQDAHELTLVGPVLDRKTDVFDCRGRARCAFVERFRDMIEFDRSEEHTSELQSRQYLVCRLLLEKKHRPVYVPVQSGDSD